MTAPDPDPRATPDITPPPAEAPAPKELPVVESPAAIAAIDDRPSELVLIPEWKSAGYGRAGGRAARGRKPGQATQRPAPGLRRKGGRAGGRAARGGACVPGRGVADA